MDTPTTRGAAITTATALAGAATLPGDLLVTRQLAYTGPITDVLLLHADADTAVLRVVLPATAMVEDHDTTRFTPAGPPGSLTALDLPYADPKAAQAEAAQLLRWKKARTTIFAGACLDRQARYVADETLICGVAMDPREMDRA